MADILDIVQASEAEINTALQKMQALIIDGRFYTKASDVNTPWCVICKKLKRTFSTISFLKQG